MHGRHDHAGSGPVILRGMESRGRKEPKKRSRSSHRRSTAAIEPEGRSVTHAFKEFAAHTATVNCLALGRKSGRVLVTGGDDKKVNLWAVGKPNCILSLGGHTTAVECVCFGATEELVCAGSLSGAIKIWDLEATKIVRTLTGHKANIRCIDFHPYGDFIATGSLDTNIKLWDIRRKGCIFTYKGHNLSVNSLKFSPDGQWIASAGEDSMVKMWDLRAGKLLTEFSHHCAPVSCVEFHPHEFLLASASHDRTVQFLDLEKFSQVSTTDADTGPIRTIAFHPDGNCVFAGSLDVLKVYGWEPARTHDTVAMGWGKIQNIAVAHNQLIAAGFHGVHVSLYVVDLKRIHPFGSSNKDDPPVFQHGNSARKSFAREKMGRESVDYMKIEEASDTGGEEIIDEDPPPIIENISDYITIFGTNKQLRRTPPLDDHNLEHISESEIRGPNHTSNSSSPLCKKKEYSAGVTDLLSRISVRESLETRKERGTSERSSVVLPQKFESKTISYANSKVAFGDVSQNPQKLMTAFRAPESNPTTISETQMMKVEEATVETCSERFSVNELKNREVLRPAGIAEVRSALRKDSVTHEQSSNSAMQQSTIDYQRQMFSASPYLSNHVVGDSSQYVSDLVTRRLPSPMFQSSGIQQPISLNRTDKFHTQDSRQFLSSYDKSGIALDSFVSPQMNNLLTCGSNSASLLPGLGAEMSEQEVLTSIVRGHSSMVSVFSNRRRSLQVVHNMWQTKDLRTAVEHSLVLGDQSLLVDVLSVLNLRSSIWNLDLLTTLLPSVSLLLQSSYESHVTCGADALKLMMKNFAPVIKCNIHGPIHSVGIDISREERYNKCVECYNQLMSVRTFLLKRQTVSGKLGHVYRELVIMLQDLDL